ncbi:MAG: aspartate--tRNA ligase [Planctomycetes bacterium]|nr:aspartate--tRNA ligase [Planctomycetota bacterium]
MPWKRTHTCGELRASDAGRSVTLAGWVESTRDHGGVVFIDLRDRYGRTQIVFREGVADEARRLRPETVVAARGTVGLRPEGLINRDLPTGEIEVVGEEVEILNGCPTPPFEIAESAESEPSEELRLRWRYLDLRRRRLQRNLQRRHEIVRAIRTYLDGRGFLDVETPVLTRSTPEGARDFLVPSRLHPGSFFALPQSPQLFKQLLMVAGVDRYYQIVRCMRDEDLRADRQFEFTQLDIEMSFIEEEDIRTLIDGLVAILMETICGVEVSLPIPCLSWADAMSRFGTDRPDMRFGAELREVTDLARESGFEVFRRTAAEGGAVIAAAFPKGGALSRREIDGLAETAKQLGVPGLAWCKVAGGLQGGIAKHWGPALAPRLIERVGAGEGDLVLFVAAPLPAARAALGELRNRLGRDLSLYDAKGFAWTWVTEFPLLEWNEEDGRWQACHHPFTSPRLDDLDRLESDPGSVRARAYDIVVNGTEIGGGSIRIHNSEVQGRVFRAIGLSEEAARAKFGFLLEALRYGAPPHGGIALGLDRLVTILLGETSIREVIAFPKTQRGTCLMTDAPSPLDADQLREVRRWFGLQPEDGGKP